MTTLKDYKAMTEKQAIKDVQAHWRRMIKCAKKYPKKYTVNPIRMKEDINELWFITDCAFCQKYDCHDCPLAKKFKSCSYNLYSTVKRLSKTWGEWIENAKRFYKKQLMKL